MTMTVRAKIHIATMPTIYLAFWHFLFTHLSYRCQNSFSPTEFELQANEVQSGWSLMYLFWSLPARTLPRNDTQIHSLHSFAYPGCPSFSDFSHIALWMKWCPLISQSTCSYVMPHSSEDVFLDKKTSLHIKYKWSTVSVNQVPTEQLIQGQRRECLRNKQFSFQLRAPLCVTEDILGLFFCFLFFFITTVSWKTNDYFDWPS